MASKQEYLARIPLEEALDLFLKRLEEMGALSPGPPEVVPVTESLGRVTAAPVPARISSPHYNAAAMDGVAVRARDTFGAAERTPVRLRLGEEAFLVDTGDPLPPGTDAVVMIEDVSFPEPGVVELIAPAVPWQHVRAVGEDFVATEMVLPSNHRIRPWDVGALLTAGVTEVAVHPRPRLALIPTGTELIGPGEELFPGAVIESNSSVLAGLVKEWGGEPLVAPRTPDDWKLLEEAFTSCLAAADVVVVIAGSSAGREDYTASLVRAFGEVFVHGVATRPGRPVILGAAAGKPVLGVPGYPVSAVLAFELFARPVVFRKQGLLPPERPRLEAYLGRKLASTLGAEEFVRVRLGKVGGKYIVLPLPRGAGAVTSLVRADGIVRVPRLSEGFPAGAKVEVELLRDAAEVAGTVVVSGSHDPLLDVLGDLFHRKHPGRRLVSSHVGSLGGLRALAAGEAHLAGIHLLDEESGEYNRPFVERYLAGRGARLVNLAYRRQGLYVPPGNPKDIRGLEDLLRPDVRFINRQRGSGTRLLLDHLLRKAGLDAGAISGYEREEYTHTAVAVAVASGSADTGLGIEAAARALGLDFIPVGEERYDLCVPEESWEDAGVQALLEVLSSAEFRTAAARLPGYDLRDCGRVWD